MTPGSSDLSRVLRGLTALAGGERGVDVFELGAPVYDLLTGHALWRGQAARLLDHLPPSSSPRRVLDLGCGPGASAFALAERLPGAQVVGVDLSPRMVRRARARQRAGEGRPEVAFLVSDGARLPFADGAFDLATGHSFLYLVPDPRAVLGEARRLLAPGGRLVLMEPRTGGSLRAAARAGAPDAAGRLLADPLAALRLGTSMCVWRVYSERVGRLCPDAAVGLLREAGFSQARWSPTLGGLGMHLVGEVARQSRGA